MSYPTFSFGRICGPEFQNLSLYVTGNLQKRDPFKYSLFSTQSACGFPDISKRAFSSLS